MDINFLVNLTSRAWCLPLLSALNRGIPARQAALMREIGAGRTALRRSLDHLVDMHLIERTPGHGHPTRPEYRLTLAGTRAARMAATIEALGLPPPHAALLRRSWTVPVLSISTDTLTYGSLRQTLPGISDRALSQSLKGLQAVDWVQREVITDMSPPRVRYRAINTGAEIAAVVAAA